MCILFDIFFKIFLVVFVCNGIIQQIFMCLPVWKSDEIRYNSKWRECYISEKWSWGFICLNSYHPGVTANSQGMAASPQQPGVPVFRHFPPYPPYGGVPFFFFFLVRVMCLCAHLIIHTILDQIVEAHGLQLVMMFWIQRYSLMQTKKKKKQIVWC